MKTSALGSVFCQRRQQFAKRVKNGAAVFLSAPPATKGRDTNYPYSPDRYLYYLSGCAEESTALLLGIRDGKICREVFLCRPRNLQREQWDGEMLGVMRARKQLGMTESGDIADLSTQLLALIKEYDSVHYLLGANPELDKQLCQHAAACRLQRSGKRLHALLDASVHLDEMRTRKTPEELDLLRKAARISADGMMAAMAAATTAKNECEIEAAVAATFRTADAQYAFSPIIAAGKHACVLHYIANNGRVAANNLILADIGAETGYYAGDISRTFPARGVFSAAQAEVYDIVLRAQRRAMVQVRAGNRWQAVEDAATKEICKGLAALHLCRGTAHQIFTKKLYKRFYMHRVGHFIGLDVHDAGNMLEADGKSRILQTGMVVTVEPGLYIPNDKNVPEQYRNIGVRIEDTVVVRRNECEVLTARAPKTRRDIETYMRP